MDVVGFITGIILAISILAIADIFNSNSEYNIVKNAINECQKELPRNIKCVITAVPEVKK